MAANKLWAGTAPLALLALAAAVAAQAQAPAPVPFTVEVPVLVLDHQGQPLLGLDQDLFRLHDNGHPQRITHFENAARPVSVAIVVDAGDRNAIAQAKRSAELMTAMVMGADGEASVYVSGPEPRQVLAYTRDQDLVANTLRHLKLAPVAPLGHGMITEPAGLAILDLAHRPATRARALLLIAKDAARSGPAATALVEAAFDHTIAIYRISPERLDNTGAPVNPASTAVGGTGQGSQRSPDVLPSSQRPGAPMNTGADPDSAGIDLTPVPRAALHVAAAVVAPHALDYVYDSGGLALGTDDNADFDRKLSSIGADLRGYYYLSFQPNDLGALSRHHVLEVTVQPPGSPSNIGKVEYRRGYLGPKS